MAIIALPHSSSEYWISAREYQINSSAENYGCRLYKAKQKLFEQKTPPTLAQWSTQL